MYFNANFIPWAEEHDEYISVLKYQMDWPIPGDPYYTEEGGVRRDFYQVDGIPRTFINGDFFVGHDFNLVQPGFESESERFGLASINSIHNIVGTTINIDVNVLPYANFTNSKLYIAVFEYLTTGNVGNNGETEFDHVMMKMIPDADGISVDLQDGEPFHYTSSMDLSGTFIEEYDDLGVLIFYQDQEDKEVFQSTYSVENGTLNQDATLSNIWVDGVPLPNFSPDVFDYEINIGVKENIGFVTCATTDTNAVAIVNQALELPGLCEINVFSSDFDSTLTYTVNIKLVGVENEDVEKVKVFPNPTHGIINFLGLSSNHYELFVYDMQGRVLLKNKDFHQNRLVLDNFENGVYFIQMKQEGELILRKKIILMK